MKKEDSVSASVPSLGCLAYGVWWVKRTKTRGKFRWLKRSL